MTQVCTELHAIMHNDYPFNCPWMPCMLSKHVLLSMVAAHGRASNATPSPQMTNWHSKSITGRPKFDQVRQLP